MSRSRSGQPPAGQNNNPASNKINNSQYFKASIPNQISDQANLYSFEEQPALVPQFLEGSIDVQLGLDKAKKAQAQKAGHTIRQKRIRQMNVHGVNPNSLMIVQAPENQQKQVLRAGSAVSTSHEFRSQDQKYNEKLNPQNIKVKKNQSSFVVLQEDQQEQPAQGCITKDKGMHNGTTAVIIYEPESLIFHSCPSVGSVSSFVVSRQKTFCKNLSNPLFTLNDMGENFVVNGKKQYGHCNSYYSISSTEKSFSENALGFLGSLQGNFLGSEFNLYQKRGNNEQLVATIHYKPDFCCANAYRVLQIFVKNPKMNHKENQKRSLRQLYQIQQPSQNKSIIKLSNKKPTWCQSMQCYTMNFRGKSRYSSIKNIILIQEGKPREQLMLFCKIGQNDFLLEIRSPLTPFIAMGIILSSFDFKLCCQ